MMVSPAYSRLFAATIFVSSFLLFMVQPLIAKQILPWFGGSAAVWTVCMVFFQVVLLAGYAYADFITRRVRAGGQALLHGGLLICSLAMLPILASSRWKPDGDAEPTLWILGLLVATVGLPYFLLASTGPLLQSWLARAPWGSRVYRYFSLSNLASLLALLAYPIIIEPYLTLRLQAYGWSAAFALFVVFCLASTWVAARLPAPVPAVGGQQSAAQPLPAASTQLLWMVLPAMGSWLLLAVTNQVTQNVASIPFLWILPLSAYLLTFILCFESDRWYRRGLFLPLAAVALAASGYGLVDSIGSAVRTAVPLYIGSLFVLCMVLHGETARLRPAPAHLTRFYLMLSAGGAIGGIGVGLVAPLLLTAYYELGIGLLLTAALGIWLWRSRWPAMLASGTVAAVCAGFLGWQVHDDLRDARHAERNFYGTLQTYDVDAANPLDRRRVVLHGSVKHGEQYLDPSRQAEPTAYYGRTAGIGQLLERLPAGPARVGLIGLGAGTLVTYGRPGDTYRLYELNPSMFTLARSEFSFLANSRARLEDVHGDARLAMERETPQAYDVLAVDAFSGGAIPVHLLTSEAFDVYLRHLKPAGVMAFHLTNRYLDLPPILVEESRKRGLHAVLVHDEADGSDLRKTDWVLISRDAAPLQPFAGAARPVSRIAGLRSWSDDFNNLFAVLR
ncbi:spermidine synthase [Piscinibacter sakaiensis]|uniref:spermidine synthase n=1 Tax=Piscinibacter sakaiensis TaxID=1547922 RepID=UPI003AB0D808